MISTVVLDAYSSDRRVEMAEAIDELCPPMGGPFGGSGLYAFWDMGLKELLYLGIASDLGMRFRQHNGLSPCPEAGCKVRQIETYFESQQLLGYTLMPQSPFDSPNSKRARDALRDYEAAASLRDLSVTGREEIVHVEGKVLGAYGNRHNGALPPWNRIGGSIFGKSTATADTEPFIDLISGGYKSALTARYALRDLASDALASWYESLLHVARFECLVRGEISGDLLRERVAAMARSPLYAGAQLDHLIQSGYVDYF